jgi:uncharacterized membrane protein YraQ (UPF0718 family)
MVVFLLLPPPHAYVLVMGHLTYYTKPFVYSKRREMILYRFDAGWNKMRTDKQKAHNGKSTFTNAFQRTVKSFGTVLPMIIGVVLLIGLFRVFVTNEIISVVFTGNVLRDTILGALIGSISAGNAIASYLIGGELLKQHVSLFAVAAFIVAWVTVGIVQFPAEAAILGKRFAVARNLFCFVLSILVSIAAVLTLMVLT